MGKEASISFLKKRNKKLLFCWLTRPIRWTRSETNKSFLVLFFKKELLPLLHALLRLYPIRLLLLGSAVGWHALWRPTCSTPKSGRHPTPSPSAGSRRACEVGVEAGLGMERRQGWWDTKARPHLRAT